MGGWSICFIVVISSGGGYSPTLVALRPLSSPSLLALAPWPRPYPLLLALFVGLSLRPRSLLALAQHPHLWLSALLGVSHWIVCLRNKAGDGDGGHHADDASMVRAELWDEATLLTMLSRWSIEELPVSGPWCAVSLGWGIDGGALAAAPLARQARLIQWRSEVRRHIRSVGF